MPLTALDQKGRSVHATETKNRGEFSCRECQAGLCRVISRYPHFRHLVANPECSQSRTENDASTQSHDSGTAPTGIDTGDREYLLSTGLSFRLCKSIGADIDSKCPDLQCTVNAYSLKKEQGDTPWLLVYSPENDGNNLKGVPEARFLEVLQLYRWCAPDRRETVFKDIGLCRKLLRKGSHLRENYETSDDIKNPCEFMFLPKKEILPQRDIIDPVPVHCILTWAETKKLWNSPEHDCPAVRVETAISARVTDFWSSDKNKEEPLVDLQQLEKNIVSWLGRLGLRCSQVMEVWDSIKGKTYLPLYIGENYLCLEIFEEIQTGVLLMCRELLTENIPHGTTYRHFLDWMKFAQLKHPLDQHQAACAFSCITNRLTVLSGRGGTGKTEIATVTARYLDAYDKKDNLQRVRGSTKRQKLCNEDDPEKPVLIAPSGKAAKVAEARSKDLQVFTLHRWIMSQHKYRNSRLLVVDECSMINLFSMYLILRHASFLRVQRILLQGDHFQLPPIQNDGCLLKTWIQKGTTTQTFILDRNYRSAEAPDLDRLLMACRDRDRVLEQQDFQGENVELHEKQTISEGLKKIVDIVQRKSEAQRKSVRVVCTQRYPLLCRTNNKPKQQKEWDTCVVYRLQLLDLFNPVEDREINVFYKGDEVMNRKNLYLIGQKEDGEQYPGDLLLANGDVGFMESEDVTCFETAKQGRVRINIKTGKCVSDHSIKDDEGQLKQAIREWCFARFMTVHKMQGSEDEHVVLWLNSYRSFNTRELLYTGMSRSKKNLGVVTLESQFKHFQKKPQIESEKSDIFSGLFEKYILNK